MSGDDSADGPSDQWSGHLADGPCDQWWGHLAGFGPFFAVDTHASGAALAPGWLPWSALIDDADVLSARIAAVRAALAQRIGAGPDRVEERVAVSVAHLGLVARLLAPAVAVAVVGGPPVVAEAADLWWQDELGGPFPLSVPDFVPRASDVAGRGTDDGAGPGTDDGAAQIGVGHLAAAQVGAVHALTDAVVRRGLLPATIAGGNVASATNSAAGMIATVRPNLAGAARAAADTVLADPRIEGGALRSSPTFRRRSCCLIYRLAGDRSAVCGDCILGPQEPVPANV